MRDLRHPFTRPGALAIVALAMTWCVDRAAWAQAEATVSPASGDAGSVHVGNSGTTTFTIDNTGSGFDLEVFDITESGTDCADFAAAPTVFTAANGNPIAPSDPPPTVTVTFTPSDRGARGCTFTLVDSDLNEDTFVASGTGTSPSMGTSPTSLDFGDVHVGDPEPLLVTISNDVPGNEALVFTAAITDGGTDYSVAPLSGTLAVGETATLTVTFTPAASGTRTGTLTISGNDAFEATDIVTLTGVGTAPDIDVSATALAFGEVRVDASPSPALTFEIGNTASGVGAETLDHAITVAGAGAAAFALDPTCASTCSVAPGGTGTITVTFTPTARLAYDATLTITSDDPDEPSVIVALSGTGIAPVIGNPVPSGRLLAFGPSDVGATSAALGASVDNTGDAVLTISSVTIAGSDAGDFRIVSGSTGAHTLPIGGTDTWQVVCEPGSIGDKGAVLRISSDALGTPTYDFDLTCTGQQAVFAFTPSSGLDFGGVPVGVSSTLTATITNAGNQAGDLTSIVSGSSVFGFDVAGGPPPVTIAPGGSVAVDVTFTPVDGAALASQLTVTTTGDPASFAIPLVGDGETQGVEIVVEGEPDLLVDLGEVRVATTVSRSVTVQNSGDTAYTLTLPTSDDAHCAIQPVSPASYPAIIPGGGSATFQVDVTPSALGAEGCVVTVASNIPTTDTIVFDFVGVAPDIELVAPAAGVLDYDAVDVDSSATQVVTVRNTGDFPLTIGGCAITGSTTFTVATDCAGPLEISEGASATLSVVFDPAVEAEETAWLVLDVDALTTDQVRVMLRGIGIDQHIDLPFSEYTFPPTYRYPDPDDIPTEMVVIANPVHPTTGLGLPLAVSMVVTDESVAGVYIVDAPGPFVVPPGGQIAVPVQFLPTAAGVTFVGSLTIFNDTTSSPMATVTLVGSGVSRAVAVSPGFFEIGTIGVGIPVRLSDLNGSGVVVSNIDPSGEEFVIREISTVDDMGNRIEDARFRVLGADQPRRLPADSSEHYDLELLLHDEGELSVLVAVFLDNDPDAHYLIELRGRAVDVELKGGGGCRAGRGAGADGFAAVAMFLVCLTVRTPLRRRRASAAVNRP